MFQVELTLYSQLCFAVSILKKSCPRPDLSPVRAPGLLRKLSISSQEIWSFASIHWTLSVIAVPHFKWSSQNIFSFPDLSLTPSLLMAAAVSSWQLQQQKQRPSAGCLISGKYSYYSSISIFLLIIIMMISIFVPVQFRSANFQISVLYAPAPGLDSVRPMKEWINSGRIS